jgi:carbon-monoxide dehydrogenase medium subunit
VALALGAEMVVAGGGGRRTVPASEFFLDYLQTAVEPDELLVVVRVPKLGEGWGFRYEKFHRVAQSWAIVGVAAAVQRSNGTIEQARVALTNMGATPVRARAVEEALSGAAPDGIAAAAENAAEGTSPPSDLNGRADYREHLARVLTRRAVAAAAGVG